MQPLVFTRGAMLAIYMNGVLLRDTINQALVNDS